MLKGRYKPEKPSAIKKNNKPYKSQENVITLFNDYSKIGSKAKYRSIYWGLKVLTPKQMLQRLPIALAQVKANNTSEN